MRAGILREKCFVERRGEQGDDGFGNIVEGWVRFSPDTGGIAASIVPIRGNEQMIAARTTGLVHYEIKVRYSSLTKNIDAGDRIVNARTGATYNVHAVVNPDMRKRVLAISCSTGGVDG